MKRRLTIPEKILVAAADLHKGDSFAAEELIVRAWETYKGDFGLQGYADRYPDSNRVLTKIMGGSSTLRKNGWIEKVGTKRYRLTDVGRLKAESLADRTEGREVERLADLARPLTNTLRRLLASPAFAKFPRHKDELSFGDVCSFLRISPRSTASQLAVREAEVEMSISLARDHCKGGAVLLPGGDLELNAQTLDDLDSLNQFFKDRFYRELDVIRSRVDERRL